jgi:O-antigen/teichoic acid export membrane protein
MQQNIAKTITAKLKTSLFKNSAWGIVSNFLQNLLLSIFFIVLARRYSTGDFADYIIANTVYSMIVGFSTLGLGHWFIRELINTENKQVLTDKFFKMQIYVGIVFYLVNIIISYSLYQNDLVRSLSVIIGINIIFDNVIYVIKYINIAELEQKKSFILSTVEAFLKFLIACLLFVTHIPIEYLSLMLIVLRLITLNLFIKFGSSDTVSLKQIITARIQWHEIRKIIAANWSFVVIGSISVIYWRIGNILVSKILKDPAYITSYEISFKLLSIAYILPIIVASTIFPILLKAYKESMAKMQAVYMKAFIAFSIYGLLAYTFIYSYADRLIPLLFGERYADTAFYCKEMFLVMIIFPTVFLQANVLLTLKLEKLDMICNAASLGLNVLLCLVGFHYSKSLSVVNYAIFFSILAFHVIQDIVLVVRKVSGFQHVLAFYLLCAGIVFSYYFLAGYIDPEYLFIIYWGTLAIAGGSVFILRRKKIYKEQSHTLRK